METKHTSYRFSDETRQLIKLLSQKLGVNDTSVLDIAIRKLAEAEGISFEVLSRTCSSHEEYTQALEEILRKCAFSNNPIGDMPSICSYCGNPSFYKDGKVLRRHHMVQRYKCKACGHLMYGPVDQYKEEVCVE